MRLVGILLVLLAAVSAAQENRKYYFEDVYAPFFVPDPGRPGWARARRPGSIPSEFQVPKPKGALRVFLIGGSTMASYIGEGSLGPALAAALPSKTVEVINCGMSGYDSSREGLVESEVLGYQPDAVVFISGHNDFHIPKGAAPPLWRLRARGWLESFAWFREISDWLRRGEAPLTPEQQYDETLRAFRANLAANVRRARRRGVTVVACTPPVDYLGLAPEGRLPWTSRAFLRGWLAMLSGSDVRARAAWGAADAAQDPGAAAYVAFSLGRALDRLGARAQANAAYERSLSREPGLSVCSPRCLQAVREVAAEEGAVLADTDAAFRRKAAPRLPGLDQFRDEFHWDRSWNHVLSDEIVASLKRAPGWAELPWVSAEPAPAPEDRDHVESVLYYAIDKIGERHENKELSWRAIDWLDWVHARRPGWFASTASLWAVTRRVLDAHFHRAAANSAFAMDELPVPEALFRWHVAHWRLQRRDLPGAERDFKAALRLDPSLAQAHLGLALTLALEGSRAAARRELETAKAAGWAPEAEALSGALQDAKKL